MQYTNLHLDFVQVKEKVVIKLHYFLTDNKIAQIILSCTLIILLWQAYLFFSLYTSYKNWQLPDITSSLALDKTSNIPGFYHINNISDQHIFGKVTKAGGTLADALKSSLPLTLKGVIAGNNSKHGEAIIQDEKGKHNVYAIGDKIPVDSGSVTLEYVFKEKIYINNNGILEYILYPVMDLNSRSLDKASNRTKNGRKEFNSSPASPSFTMPEAEDQDEDLEEPNSQNTPNTMGPQNPQGSQNNAPRESLNKRLFNKFNKANPNNNQYKRNYN